MYFMSPTKRILKRLVIVLIYVLIAALLGLAAYFIVKPKPTCFDGIQNQNEEGVDCGGPCVKKCETPVIDNLKIEEKAIVTDGFGSYDVLAKVTNPNAEFGAASFKYAFDLLGSDGEILEKKEGTSFILPAQTKYILAFNLKPRIEPASLEFRIISFKWLKFLEYEEPSIDVYSKELNIVSSGIGFAELKAKIRNRSDYDFKEIVAKIVIRDQHDKPVALNQTSINDVRVNDEREIVVRWDNPFSVDPVSQKIEIEKEVNVLDNYNFMEEHGTQEQYESYDFGNVNDQTSNE